MFKAFGALVAAVAVLAGLVLIGAALIVAIGAQAATESACDVTGVGAITAVTDVSGQGEGGIGFEVPAPGVERLASLKNPPVPVPERIKVMYVAGADRYHLPWALLAGIGMEETVHGRARAASSAGAQGLMQFMPATWGRYGVDGSGDGIADIRNDADSVMSAANYLTAAGVASGGPDGVRRALFAYNHAQWYVNDVLFYATAYGGGVIAGDPDACGAGGEGNPALPPISNDKVRQMLTWAQTHLGEPYVYGAAGPQQWDCSGFTRAAFAQIGITLPRTASAQHDWVAHGNGFRVVLGQERPGDLVFTDSYLGPNQVGHVMIVLDPTRKLTVEAGGDEVGNYSYAAWETHHLFSIWRVGAAA